MTEYQVYQECDNFSEFVIRSNNPKHLDIIKEAIQKCLDEDHNLAELARLQGIDCNVCKHISLTEARQRWEGSSIMPHICAYYKEICRHNSNDPNARYIYPCDKCLQDNHRYFERYEERRFIKRQEESE